MLKGIRERAEHAVKSRLYGRPSGIVSLADWRNRNPDSWFPAFPPDATPRKPARRFGMREAGLEAMALPIPEMGVLGFAMGRALGRSSYCHSSEGELVRETSWQGDALANHHLDASYPKPRRLVGRCLSLVSEFARINYGHFILDALGRIEIAREAGFAPEAIDHFYCYRPTSPSARQLMAALGIDPAKCIWANDVRCIEADQLLVTTFPGTKRNYARFVPRAMRRPFEPGPASEGRRIYIPRPGVRKPSNQAELEEIALELGLEIYDFRKVDDEFAFMRKVDLVVGAHGSDLANVGVCREGTRVIELIASDHVHPYFYTLAEGAGLDYGYIVGKSEIERPASAALRRN
jgi:capsular polysaccharide biosynthesis protein